MDVEDFFRLMDVGARGQTPVASQVCVLQMLSGVLSGEIDTPRKMQKALGNPDWRTAHATGQFLDVIRQLVPFENHESQRERLATILNADDLNI